MKTVIIQIGNSDNKLTQNNWAHYVEETRLVIEKAANEVHFFGGSPNWYPWQNVAWVIVGNSEALRRLKDDLWLIRKKYGQDSVAWTEGETQFI